MTSWEALWLGLLVFGAVVFGVAETVALAKGESLSRVLRRWLGVAPRKPRRIIAVPLFVAALLGFVAWFVPHIVRWE